jgi:Spy/CpxP family protein refolding chaperone
MKRWAWAALGLSIVLNILLAGYVAGALWRPTRPGAEAIGEQLDLRPEQRAAFQTYLRTAREGHRRLREETAPLLQQSWRELAKPQPDDAAVERLFEEGAAKREAVRRETIGSMRAFMATLEPEQRERFLELMRERFERRAARRASQR